MNRDPLLSAIIITYNHEKHIAKAIESVLMQKTDFDFEIVIGEDFSNDSTKKIVNDYASKYPKKIKALHHPHNLGFGGKANFLKTRQACHGKYIAMCEGDDYWIDENKLQKQVDFLETNPGYAICCHRVYIKKDDEKPKLYPNEYMPLKETTFDIEMMARIGNLIATPSVVYRNGLFQGFPSWFDQSPIGDYVLHMMNAQHGKIKYFPEAMAVYREHRVGAWSGQSVMTNAGNMIKVIGLLLRESFEESVKKGLQEQLKETKAAYLHEMIREDPDRFNQELDRIAGNDKREILLLVGQLKRRSHRSYAQRAIQKLKRLFLLF